MIRWFRRQRPAPPPPAPRLSVSDALVAHYAGLTEAEWLALTDQARADYRWRSGLAHVPQ